MKYRFVFDRLETAADKELETLHIIGGGTKNSLLNQLTADVMGVKVLTGPVEASAAGNILLQAFGCGELGSHEEIREAVRNSFVLEEFLPSGEDDTESAYQRFLRVTGLNA
jgi:rhamnulokinase